MKTSSVSKTFATKTINGEDVELELPQSPSPVMNYAEEFFRVSPNGDHAVLGYLVDDLDCANPLENDGEGGIYSSHRNAGREDHRKMQEALGLDSAWNPDIDQDEERERYVAAFVKHYMGNFDKLSVEDKLAELAERDEGESQEDYLKRCAEEDFDAYPSDYMLPDVLKTIRKELWEEKRNPLAVSLDVYEHGGIAYSVSGAGMQDRFDTSRGGAIWVPDDVAKDGIEYRAIKALLPEGTSVQYLTSAEKASDLVGVDVKYTLPDGTEHAICGSFVDGIRAAAGALDIQLDEKIIQGKMQEVARDYAKSIAENYTKWVNGENYGWVVQCFDKTSDGSWEQGEEEAVYGFVGSEYALEEMSSTGKYFAEKYDKLNLFESSMTANGFEFQEPNLSSSVATNYVGSVFMDNELFIAQKTNRNTATIHEKSKLDAVPAVGDQVTISYKDGRGRVESLGKENGLGQSR